MQRLSVPAIWDGMTALVLGDLSRLFFVAAPFTLLPSVAVQLFVPPLPPNPLDVSGQQLLWAFLLPALLGNFAQLAITALMLRTSITPRTGFAVALPLWPGFMVALLLASAPVALGFMLLVLPSFYLYARLLFLLSAVTVAEPARPLALLQRSWALTAPVQAQLFLFVIVALFGVVGVLMMTSVAGAALDVVARALGLEAVGRFVVAVCGGIASTIVAIAGAAVSVFVYRELAP